MDEKFKELLDKNHKSFISEYCFAGFFILAILILFISLGSKVSFKPLLPFISIAILFGFGIFGGILWHLR